MAKRVLVTGVSGFLGGALGKRLRSAGWHVTGVSRRPARAASCDVFVAGDLGMMDMGGLGIFDAVVHCAALAAPWGPRREFERQNVAVTRRMVEFAERCGGRHFVFVSSSSVFYRWGDQLGIREDSPWEGAAVNEYARTKREAEVVVRQSGLPWTIVRPRAIFGPEDSVLFPRILRAARSGSLPRIVREDGQNTVGDLIYIESLTEMLARVLDLRALGDYNLTNEEPVELYPFLESIFAELGYPPIRRRLPAQMVFGIARGLELVAGLTGDRWEPPLTRFGVEVMVHSKTFDVSKAVRDLGHVPIGIEEGRRRFVAWQR